MKKKNLTAFLLIAFALGVPTKSQAQWVETNGPYEAAVGSLAASDSFIFASTVGEGIYRSTDNGVTWTPSNGGMTSTFANCLAVSGNNVYAGSATGYGISLSTDNGTTWTAVNNGLPPNPYGSQVGVIKELVVSGENVFASIYPTGLSLSTNSGSNWTDANAGAISGISAIDVIGNSFFIGSNNGVYMSTNGGTTWTVAGLPDSAIISFAASGTNLFASTNSGVFLSPNNGTTWTSADSGLPDSGIGQISANGSYLIASTVDGYFLSTDNGTSWTALNTASLPVEALGNFTPIGTNLYFASIVFGIFRSTNNGRDWAVSNTGMEELSITALAATKNTAFVSSSTSLYASSPAGMNWIWTRSSLRPNALTAVDTLIYATSMGGGVCYSSDKGNTWTTPSNIGAPDFSTSLAVNGNNIFIGTYDPIGDLGSGGVYLSTNNGSSWKGTQIVNQSPIGPVLAVNGTNIYAVNGNNSLLVSTDTASTWDSLLTPAGRISAIAFSDSEIFVGSYAGILRSIDGGKHWDSLNTGLPGSPPGVNCLTVHGTNVFAGTSAGVYILNNDNTSWTAVNTGLPSASGIMYLAATDSTLYEGLSGTVWERPISDMITAVKPPSANTPATFSLFQNFPNPFNPTTVINYQLPVNTLVRLKVYDALGRLVRTLVNENQTAGTHSVTFNASNLSSGVYFYRLSAGNFVSTKKLMLLK